MMMMTSGLSSPVDDVVVVCRQADQVTPESTSYVVQGALDICHGTCENSSIFRADRRYNTMGVVDRLYMLIDVEVRGTVKSL